MDESKILSIIGGILLEAYSRQDKQAFVRFKKDRLDLLKLGLMTLSDYSGPEPYCDKYLKLTLLGENLVERLYHINTPSDKGDQSA